MILSRGNPNYISQSSHRHRDLTNNQIFLLCIITSITTQATVLKEAQLQNEVNVALLSDALEVQEELMTDLLQSLGIGQNVDIVV